MRAAKITDNALTCVGKEKKSEVIKTHEDEFLSLKVLFISLLTKTVTFMSTA